MGIKITSEHDDDLCVLFDSDSKVVVAKIKILLGL